MQSIHLFKALPSLPVLHIHHSPSHIIWVEQDTDPNTVLGFSDYNMIKQLFNQFNPVFI